MTEEADERREDAEIHRTALKTTRRGTTQLAPPEGPNQTDDVKSDHKWFPFPPTITVLGCNIGALVLSLNRVDVSRDEISGYIPHTVRTSLLVACVRV